MSGDGDHFLEMPSPALDDRTVDAFLSGRSTRAEELGSLAGFVEDLRVAVDRPLPAPSAELATLLTDGIPTPTGVTWDTAPSRAAAQAADSRKRRTHVSIAELLAALTAKLAGLGMATKAALGLGIAATSVTGAGAAGVLPDPAQHAVASVVSAATPFEIPDPDDPATGAVTDGTGTGTGTDDVDGSPADGARENHGACVSEVAKSAPRGPGSTHGQAVSTAARSDCGKSSSTSTTIGSTTTTTIDDTTTTTLDDGDDDPAVDSANRGPGSANSGPGNGNGKAGPGKSGNGNGNGNSGPGNSGNGNSGNGNGNSGNSGKSR